MIASSCAYNLNYKEFKEEQKKFPVFSIGDGLSWSALIFEDSYVYGRSWTDYGPYLSEKFRLYRWTYLNDTTIYLHRTLDEEQRLFEPRYHTLIIHKSSEKCQLLIPLDNLEKFNEELRADFQKEVVSYKFPLNQDIQVMIDADSVSNYPLFLEEDFSGKVLLFLESFKELDIYTGTGF